MRAARRWRYLVAGLLIEKVSYNQKILQEALEYAANHKYLLRDDPRVGNWEPSDYSARLTTVSNIGYHIECINHIDQVFMISYVSLLILVSLYLYSSLTAIALSNHKIPTSKLRQLHRNNPDKTLASARNLSLSRDGLDDIL